jgi:hypothetical protein
MEENTNNEQQINEEQLQDVTGGLLFGGLFNRSPKVNPLDQINYHQNAATGLFQQAANHRARGNNTYANMLERNANGHLDAINNLNAKFGR